MFPKSKKMKDLIIFLMFFVVATNITAQPDSLFDCIDPSEIYLVRTGSDLKAVQNVSFLDIKSIKTAEQLFGLNYKSRKYFDNMINENCTELKYEDGLKLNFEDIPIWLKNFEVTTDKYTLYFKNGGTIKVGMKGEDLKAIFPKSYKLKKAYDYDRNLGTESVIVYFCYTRDNKEVIQLTWLLFRLSTEKKVIERIETVTPE
jgi:hypothetical protein